MGSVWEAESKHGLRERGEETPKILRGDKKKELHLRRRKIINMALIFVCTNESYEKIQVKQVWVVNSNRK